MNHLTTSKWDIELHVVSRLIKYLVNVNMVKYCKQLTSLKNDIFQNKGIYKF